MKPVLIASTFLLLAPHVAIAAGFEMLKPHRAIYDVQLNEAEDRSGISALTGRIVYETRGNACEGISIQYRFVTQISTGRDRFVTDQQSASFESADGEEFSFTTKSFVNDQADQNLVGSAMRVGEGLTVKLEGDNPRELELDDGLFTSSHLVAVLESAQRGEVFVSHQVFDGSGDADDLLRSASVIGKARRVSEPLEGEEEGEVDALLTLDAWPVTMSYFKSNPDNSGEALPIYEASFLLYGNGVTRDLTMKYPDYELKATLSELEFLDAGECE